VTTIVIAHRLSTIINCDNILVLKKGIITEEGNHSTLLENYPEGVYAKLVRDQQQDQGQDDEMVDDAENEFLPQEDGSEEIISQTNQKSKKTVKKSTVKESMVTSRHGGSMAGSVSYKGMTRREKELMKMADVNEAPVEEAEQKIEKEYKKMSFIGKLSPHTKPTYMVFSGFLFSIVQGCVFPVFGIFIMKEIFDLGLYNQYTHLDPALEKTLDNEAEKWCLFMLMMACISLVGAFF
jgi:ABC-type glutathione transport system ATPase component